jgi:hypothetical protein
MVPMTSDAVPLPPSPEPDEEPVEMTAEEMAVELLDMEAQRRGWVRTIQRYLVAQREEGSLSPRVRFASDSAMVAGYERLGRIFRSDLPADKI